jgi:hypothetical protein
MLIVFMKIHGGCIAKVFSGLDLAAESSQQRTYVTDSGEFDFFCPIYRDGCPVIGRERMALSTERCQEENVGSIFSLLLCAGSGK